MKKYIVFILIVSGFMWAGNAKAYELGEVDIHGFISQGFLQSDKYDYLTRTDDSTTSEGTFEYNEMGLNFSTSLTEDLRVGAQLYAMDIVDYGNDEIRVDWAFGDYRCNNYLGIRAGKFKIAHGLHNEVRDIDAVRTFILLPRGIYFTGMRDLFGGMKGAGLYGELPAGVSYQGAFGTVTVEPTAKVVDDVQDSVSQLSLLTVNDTFVETFTTLNQVAGMPLFDSEADTTAILVGSTIQSEVTAVKTRNSRNLALRWSPPGVDGLRLSGTYFGAEAEFTLDWTGTDIVIPDATAATIDFVSAASGGTAPDAATLDAGITTALTGTTAIVFDEISTTVFSIEYVFGDTELSFEYNMTKVDITDQPTNDSVGWTLGASHRFTEWFELGGYYSDYNDDVDDSNGALLEKIGYPKEQRWLKEYVLAGRFDINDYWIAKIEGHLMNGLYRVNYENYESDRSKVNPDWFLFAAKLSYSF